MTARTRLGGELLTTLLGGPFEGLFTVVIALVLGFLVLAVTGKDAVTAYVALLTGPFTRLGRTGQWIEITSNLIFVGLAASIAFRSRLFNLGLSSQVLMGATSAFIFATFAPLPPLVGVIVPLFAAMAGGFLLGVIPGAMRAHIGASEILTSLMLNFITPLGIELVFSVWPWHRDLPHTSWLPRLSEVTPLATGTLHAGILIALVATLGAWVLLERTPLGYAIGMAGANERFARYGGIDTRRVITLAFGLSGAFAALTGANLLMGLLRDPFVSTASFTYDGLVVALLARNRPLVVPVAALLYAYLLVGADRMEQAAQVGSEIVRVVQAVIVLLVAAPTLVRWWRGRRSEENLPAALNAS